MGDINTLLNRLEKVKQTGTNKWQGCCPAHDDRNPSLALKEVDGRILLHCFSGCPTESIVSALGLKMSDLMPDNGIPPRKDKNRPSNSELLGQLEQEVLSMLSCIGHYKKRIPVHEQDTGRMQLAFKRIKTIWGVLYE